MLSMMSVATSAFDFKGKSSCGRPSAKIRLTLLVGTPNPAPASRREFNTIISRFLRCSLSMALEFSLSVSSANPINICPLRLFAPKVAAISGFLTS